MQIEVTPEQAQIIWDALDNTVDGAIDAKREIDNGYDDNGDPQTEEARELDSFIDEVRDLQAMFAQGE